MIFHKFKKNNFQGFTIVEMMVASSLFVAIMAVGTTAIVSIYRTYNAQRVQRQAVNQLGSAVDLIARQMMTGLFYTCSKVSNTNISTMTRFNCFVDSSGASGIFNKTIAVSFVDEDARQIRYSIGTGATKGLLLRNISTAYGNAWGSDNIMLDTYASNATTNKNSTYSIDSARIYIRGVKKDSTNATSGSSDECMPVQPFAIVRFTVVSGTRKFFLQTGVAMRRLDLPAVSTIASGCPAPS